MVMAADKLAIALAVLKQVQDAGCVALRASDVTRIQRERLLKAGSSDEPHARLGRRPWTIVPVERRADYMAALERASVDGDIRPFASFLAELVKGGARKSK